MENYLVNFDTATLPQEEADILIIGSGIAGLYAALKLSSVGKTVILTKGKEHEGSTEHAQGGIAAVLSKEDSLASHYEDTLKAGDGFCNTQAVNVLVKEGKAEIYQLRDWGVPFDMAEGKLALTREGAHSQFRIVHAGGDATGYYLQKTLMERRRERGIEIRENILALDLLVEGGRVKGVLYFNKEKRRLGVLLSPVLILATGGLGQIYEQTSNPLLLTGDGIAMAYRAGLPLMDMEFIQFHPTSIYLPKGEKSYLVSEAVRGEGAILCNLKREPFMERYHPLKDLAPRDVTARAILNEMKKAASPFVYLNLKPLGQLVMASRFPSIYKYCQKEGIPVEKGFIPVAPAAHYFMGGVRVNLNGETGIKGLYASGEVSCSGLHGANRLASNSLLEALVFGKRMVLHITKVFSQLKREYTPSCFSNNGLKEGVLAPQMIEERRRDIKETVERGLGIIRSQEGLRKAIGDLSLNDHLFQISSLDPDLLELKNMITTARLVGEGALHRKESRGGHYREDYKTKEKGFARRFVQTKDSNWEEDLHE